MLAKHQEVRIKAKAEMKAAGTECKKLQVKLASWRVKLHELSKKMKSF